MSKEARISSLFSALYILIGDLHRRVFIDKTSDGPDEGCKPYYDRAIVAFVDGLTGEQLEMLKEYLKEKEER
jgi:hypothetical protein